MSPYPKNCWLEERVTFSGFFLAGWSGLIIFCFAGAFCFPEDFCSSFLACFFGLGDLIFGNKDFCVFEMAEPIVAKLDDSRDPRIL